ncbi:hypothetical protein [Streptomyces sp. NPDC096153]|uniref:hypothetical protein n=1 Tax=Streptomyces sp. NPDC096153 TaxID=3155548 RepID=UPI00332249CD
MVPIGAVMAVATPDLAAAQDLYAVLPRPAGPGTAGRPDTEEEPARATVSI